MIPHSVTDRASLRAIAVYAVLARHADPDTGEAWPGRERVAAALGCRTWTVDQGVKELQALGEVIVQRRGRGLTNRYILTWHRDRVAAHRDPDSRSTATLDSRSTAREQDPEEQDPAEQDSREAVEAEFLIAWECYPRKVNRTGACRAYYDTRARGASAEELYRATENYAAARVGEDETFTLHGKNFYGPDEQWRDWLDPPRRSSRATTPGADWQDEFDGGRERGR